MNDQMLPAIAQMLDASGVSLDDLAGYLEAHGIDAPLASTTITVAEHVERVSGTLTPGTKRGYKTHFNRFKDGIDRQCACECNACLDQFDAEGTCRCTCGTCEETATEWKAAGDRRLRDREFTRTEIMTFPELARRMARKKAMNDNRRRARRGKSPKPDHGQGGQEMAVSALRCLFERAVDDEHMTRNPAEKLDKGARGETRRRPLTPEQLDELFEFIATVGDDPELDLLISWCELTTLARRGGVLDLTMGSLLTERQTAILREKGRKDREQPIPAELLEMLFAHAAVRGGARCVPGHPDFDPNAPVLYYSDSTPERPHRLTSRRFDTLHDRIQRKFPWADEMGYTGHVLRHTTATTVERLLGAQVAKGMLGHRPKRPDEAYTKARMNDVVEAFEMLTGESHPLAPSGPVKG